jgi:hypothetical protein
MIYAAAAVIADEHGPDKSRRVLSIAGEAQGEALKVEWYNSARG